MPASRLSTSASASLPVGSAGCATCAPSVAPLAWLAFSKACAISPSHISTLPLPSTKVLAVFAATVESAVPEVAGGALSVTVTMAGLTSPEEITVTPSASVTDAPIAGCGTVTGWETRWRQAQFLPIFPSQWPVPSRTHRLLARCPCHVVAAGSGESCHAGGRSALPGRRSVSGPARRRRYRDRAASAGPGGQRHRATPHRP